MYMLSTRASRSGTRGSSLCTGLAQSSTPRTMKVPRSLVGSTDHGEPLLMKVSVFEPFVSCLPVQSTF